MFREPISVGGYNAYVFHEVLSNLGEHVIKAMPANKYVLISDENVYRIYGERVKQSFLNANVELLCKVIVPGEGSKCRAVKAGIEDWMLQNQCNRDSCIVALGGGVVGDLAGFVASTYMRGIPFVQVPTSMLAMVDSSIGGKTGIDTDAGKNLVGAFHKPKAVFVDVSSLKTLPYRELCNGLAEAIKHGAIKSEELFKKFEEYAEQILSCDLSILTDVVYESIKIKADVVVQDFKESGIRSILNFGHSIGHAVESYMQPALLHGECVSIGMVEEALLARSMGYVTTAHISRLKQCLQAYELPVTIPIHLTVSMLLKKMAVDKKNKKGIKKIVMLSSIGNVYYDNSWTVSVTDDLLLQLFSQYMCYKPTGPVYGNITVPGSKSVSNRILLISALGKGTCRISGLLHSQDTQVMLGALSQMGVVYEWDNSTDEIIIQGCEGKLDVPKEMLYFHNAGTASRFMTTCCCTIPNGEIILTGNARMKQRPIGDLVDALVKNGMTINYIEKKGCLPLKIQSKGGLLGGDIILDSTVSSQYVSSIMLSAPYAIKPVTLHLQGTTIVSRPYIEMTINLMKQFGIEVKKLSNSSFFIPQGIYTNPSSYAVEGDASSASYPLAMAAISGGSVTVTNVGSASLQGDSHFAELLCQMGCKVTQTATSTSVTGKILKKMNNNTNTSNVRFQKTMDHINGQQQQQQQHDSNIILFPDLNGINIDMDSMTDCFMTLCAVAAVANGETNITNISNQRVKECNRIEVMVTELKKCGINAKELPTGISIIGCSSYNKLCNEKPVIIECHDDHRVAMSFAVLNTLVPGIVMNEKRCVNKTFPNFWDETIHCLGMKSDINTIKDCNKKYQNIKQKQSIYKHSMHKDSFTIASDEHVGCKYNISSRGQHSIVIIGMRGAGKTTLGKYAALELGLDFVDVDEAIEQKIGMTITDLVTKTSWENFRHIEHQVFSSLLLSHEYNYVISCGGGIIERIENRILLKKWHLVIQVHRPINDIVKYLTVDKTRPHLEIIPVWERRKPLFRECSHYQYDILENDTIQTSGPAFGTFCRQIIEHKDMHLGQGTFFLSLTFPDINNCLNILPEISMGVDALELRVDLLRSYDHDFVGQQLSLLRRHTSLPIIFTIRTKSQGGKFIDDEKQVFDMLEMGIRYACEYLDVETHWEQLSINNLLSIKRVSKIIASHHEPKSNGGTDENMIRLFRHLTLNGQADIVKLVVSATCQEDAVRILQIGSQEQKRFSKNIYSNRIPDIIVLAMGVKGQLSRVLNKVMSPVTHPLLPFKAAPGQLSVIEIQQAREMLGISPSKSYCLFGSPIAMSPSPLMHNTCFNFYGLPGMYTREETSDINHVKAVMKKKDFGGANVTIPLKEKVIPLLDEKTIAVEKIGACNTIVNVDGRLVGDNTDWLGICLPLQKYLPRRKVLSNEVAIVVGAGGTARAALFAFQQLGFIGKQLMIHNPRTPSKAITLAKEFQCHAINSLDRIDILSALNKQGDKNNDVSIRVVLSTLPGSVQFTVPKNMFDQSIPFVAFSASYYPKNTSFTIQAEENGLNIVRGIDMLLAQGFAGFELWSGRPTFSARKVVEDKVNEYYDKLPRHKL